MRPPSLSLLCKISLMDSSFPLSNLPRGCARCRVQRPLVLSFLQLLPELVDMLLVLFLGGESLPQGDVLLLELMSLFQELSMHLSISILQCCCSHLNFTCFSKILLLEVKSCISHLCLKVRFHISQVCGVLGLLLLHIMVEVLFSLHGEFIPKGSRNFL